MKFVFFLPLFVFSACASSSAQGDSLNDSERQEKFLELFEMEVQNRAFALLSAERGLENATSDGDKIFLGAWLDWERFLKERYAPYAKKYGLTQEPETGAKMQANLAVVGQALLPDSKVMNLMLDNTISYVEKLRELERVSPEEDRAFFAFVVEQEEAQVDALRLRVDEDYQGGADVLRNFMKGSSAGDSAVDL
ncbi:MAG: hypothetical protein AAFX94_02195 [Myxococcota bacterium]